MALEIFLLIILFLLFITKNLRQDYSKSVRLVAINSNGIIHIITILWSNLNTIHGMTIASHKS